MNVNYKPKPIAAVCGNEVRIYNSPGYKGIRPLIKAVSFNNKGQAVLFAQEFDENKV